jgi:hypothetical protein
MRLFNMILPVVYIVHLMTFLTSFKISSAVTKMCGDFLGVNHLMAVITLLLESLVIIHWAGSNFLNCKNYIYS